MIEESVRMLPIIQSQYNSTGAKVQVDLEGRDSLCELEADAKKSIFNSQEASLESSCNMSSHRITALEICPRCRGPDNLKGRDSWCELCRSERNFRTCKMC